MELPKVLESWSWLAGIFSAVLALAMIAWQAGLAFRRRGRKGDWDVLDRAFHGVRIGAQVKSLQSLPLKPMARSGDGKIKMTKWRLASGNELSVTYDSEQDRILYAELDWDFRPGSVDSGIAGLRFGESTLERIRKKFSSNGFSYVEHMMFKTENGLVTFNAFELKRTPSIAVVFVSLLKGTSSLGPQPSDKQLSHEIGKLFNLVAVVVADESYLDEIWGNNKIYDPTSTPIKLWSWHHDA